MNLNFWTWNIKDTRKKDIFFRDLSVELDKRKIDILVLQECYFDNGLLELTDFDEIPGFISGRGIRKAVRIFLNKNSGITYSSMTPHLSNKLRCVELTAQNGFVFNLFGAHLYSMAGKSRGQQFFQNEEIPKLIENFELRKTSRSIIVGDLNYVPFDSTLANPYFLNTTNDRDIIRKFNTRLVKSNRIRFFYNPMWNLLGDLAYNNSAKPAGTYYISNDVEKFHWNLIDGVLLSPPLMDNIEIESIEIITQINGKQLLSSRIDHQDETIFEGGFSDHLPVIFTIKTD